MDAADKYITVLQERFPNVTVKWTPPPHPIFETQLCTLTFTPKLNPEVIYEVDLPHGLGNNKIEDDIEVFITINGKKIDAL